MGEKSAGNAAVAAHLDAHSCRPRSDRRCWPRNSRRFFHHQPLVAVDVIRQHLRRVVQFGGRSNAHPLAGLVLVLFEHAHFVGAGVRVLDSHLLGHIPLSTVVPVFTGPANPSLNRSALACARLALR